MAPLHYTNTPSTFAEMVIPRQLYGIAGNDCDIDGSNCDDSSSWDSWGRWVALVVIIVFFILLGFVLSFLSNRHRRRAGRGPMPGTAWVPYVNGLHGNAPPAYGQHNDPQNNYPMNMSQGADAMAPPKYGGPVDAQQTGNTFSAEQGYYGANQGTTSAVEMQQPANVYAAPNSRVAGDEEYAPPSGPPPSAAAKTERDVEKA